MRIGIDIGGTKTDAVAVFDDGVLSRRIRLPTGFGPAAVIDAAVASIERVVAMTGVEIARIESIGVGIPGMVDGDGGVVHHAVNLGFDELDLGYALAQRLGVSIRVENDVKAAAVGAYHLLGQEGSMAYLNLGTGLAAGLVIQGSLWRGAHGTAGEIGHIPVDPSGAECLCGQRGCLETIASGSAIARQWPTRDPHPARALFAAADAGDARARSIVDALVHGIASAVRVLVLTADVDAIVIGGGLSHLGRPLIDGVHRVLSGWEAASPFIAALSLPSRVSAIPDGMPAAAVGAALIGVVPAPAV